jgi:4-carboxymuconolactone decarboxylase
MLTGNARHSGGRDVSQSTETFTPRLAVPRVPPIGKLGRTPAQEAMLANRPDFNIYKTLAHNPELYQRWGGLGQYLLSGSTLPARDREIIILRMGWLCQAPYEWAQHARIAKASAAMTDADVLRISRGREAAGWSNFERTLIDMVDELRYETQIDDATWTALRSKYSLEQVIDALFTAGQYQLVSMALNSTGVQLDPELRERIPADTTPPALASRPRAPRLAAPRIAPLTAATMTPEQRQLVGPQTRDGRLPNLYATLVVHTRFYEPRLRFGIYLQRDSHLPPRTRELLILRTAWNAGSEYEWAHHTSFAREAGFTDAEIARVAQGPAAAGWSEEQGALLRAADELRRETLIADSTWNTLGKFYEPASLLEIIYTVGGYAMTAMAINSLGIQLEAEFRHGQELWRKGG